MISLFSSMAFKIGLLSRMSLMVCKTFCFNTAPTNSWYLEFRSPEIFFTFSDECFIGLYKTLPVTTGRVKNYSVINQIFRQAVTPGRLLPFGFHSTSGETHRVSLAEPTMTVDHDLYFQEAQNVGEIYS